MKSSQNFLLKNIQYSFRNSLISRIMIFPLPSSYNEKQKEGHLTTKERRRRRIDVALVDLASTSAIL